MPKRRSSPIRASSSAGGASGGGTGTGAGASIGSGAAAGMAAAAEELNRMLSEPINIMSHSSVRGMENVSVRFTSPTRAQVLSGSGRTYNVDISGDGDCDCSDHIYRQRRCRHIRAAEEALGRITREPVVENPVRAQIADAQPEQEYVRQADISDILPETIEPEDDNFYVSDLTDEEFERMLEEARNGSLPYEYENVLNGSNATFGLEIEYACPGRDTGEVRRAIAEELARLGLGESSDVISYGQHHRTRDNMAGRWRVTTDSTVDGEIVSPVLRDTPETWKQIEQVCEVIRRHGGQINNSCGGHVHVGVDPMNHSRERWRRLKRLLGTFEDVLLNRLSNGDLDRLRGNAASYAGSIGERMRWLSDRRVNIREDEGDAGIRRMGGVFNVRGSRYSSVNFENLQRYGEQGVPKTIEFRSFNGSLNPAVIQTHVKISVGIVEAANRARIRDSRTRRRGEMLRNAAYDAMQPAGQGMFRNFLDIVFTRRRDKEAIMNRYARASA